MAKNIVLPAEWHRQRLVQITWPHMESDWAYLIKEVEECFCNIAFSIAIRQPLLIVCPEKNHVQNLLLETFRKQDPGDWIKNITFFECCSNDTWARDHGGITVFDKGKPLIYDFSFNGWGMKFPAFHDNLITRKLVKAGIFEGYRYSNMNFFILEGGSIESDGKGTIMTTEQCLLSANRNDSLSKSEIESCLREFFGAERILWLKNGFLEGDDTDSHIDTLARFCFGDTIAFMKCNDQSDIHFNALSKMEEELKEFRQPDGQPYNLIPLPMPPAVTDPDDGHRLPATYANFLIMNHTVLVPVYNCETDEEALKILKNTFRDRDIIPIDCSVLIRQHGSLHCVTMQYPAWENSNSKESD